MQMAMGKTGAIVMTTPRRDLIIGAGAFVCLAKILRPTVPANAAEGEGFADFGIISGSKSVVAVSVEAGEVIVDVSINGHGPYPLMFDTGAPPIGVKVYGPDLAGIDRLSREIEA